MRHHRQYRKFCRTNGQCNAVRQLRPSRPKVQLSKLSSHVLAMSLLHEDGETQIIAQSYGAVALLDKALLLDELIPAIHRVSQNGQHTGS